jgi:very-short-patch-repair endonuclease
MSERAQLEDNLFAELKLYGLPVPERQFYFLPTRKWRSDFAWPTLKILVEVQGGIFMPAGTGGHNRGAYMEKEYEKANEAQKLGWKIFKFGPKACRRPKNGMGSSKALAFLYDILKERRIQPSCGEGESK